MHRLFCVSVAMLGGCGGTLQNLGQDPDGGGTAVDAGIPGSDSLPKRPSIDAGSNKLVFVTSRVYSANLGGLSGADAKCQAHAEAAGLPGVYKAWLSDSTTFAADRFTHAEVPYTLIDGTRVAADWSTLTSGSILHAINLSDARGEGPGARINPCLGGECCAAVVWTGTDPSGSWDPDAFGLQVHDCNGWTTTAVDGSRLWLGNWSSDFLGGWTESCLGDCTFLAPLYCFEQ
jgi:hypothetical protein